MKWLTIVALVTGLAGCRGSLLSPTPAQAAEAKGAHPPKGMVVVPAGKFTMGCTEAKCDEREPPLHEVELDAFYMDVYEVSVEEYAACVKAGACTAIAEPSDEFCTTSGAVEGQAAGLRVDRCSTSLARRPTR